MTAQLSPRVSRVAAIGLLVVVLLAVHSLIVQPIVDAHIANLATIEQANTALARYRAIGREAPALADKLQALQASGPAGYLEGSDETMTAAALQNRLQILVGHEGGQLNSVQVLPAKPDGPAVRIAVRGQMLATIGTLQRILYQIESGYLFIDDIEIRAVTPARGGPEPEFEMPLDVRFDVHGYMRGKA